jgi:hypothetical protein
MKPEDSRGKGAIPRYARASTIGSIGLGLVVLWWPPFLLPKRISKPLVTASGSIGPFWWLLLLGMVVLPIMAAKRGSNWWLSVSVAGVITWVVLISAIH